MAKKKAQKKSAAKAAAATGPVTLAQAKTLASQHEAALQARLGTEKYKLLLDALRNF